MLLLACSSCRRAYDVSALDSDEHVRCVCGELLTVERARERRIEVLVCARCGGTVEEGSPTCGYCQGTLRRGLLCHQCGRALEPDARHCSGCAAELVSQHLRPLPDGRVCPRCNGELAHRVLPDVTVIECTMCAGLWLDQEAFRTVCKRAVGSPGGAPAPASIESLPDPSPMRYLRCVTCECLMMRKLFQHGGSAGPVIIDVCREHGLWLDRDELERLLLFVRQKASQGVPPPASPFPYVGPPAAARPPIQGSAADAYGPVPERSSWLAAGLMELFEALFTFDLFP